MDWRHRSACLDEDPELFFPDGETPRYARQIAAAQQVCAACPVREDCLRAAIEGGHAAGIWGGLLPGERARLVRRASARDGRGLALSG